MKSQLTVNELFEKVWNSHWNKERFISSGWAAEARRSFTQLIAPALGNKYIDSLKAAHVRAWHQKLAATPTQANRALGVLSKMLSFAEGREWRPQGTNVCRLVKPYVERKRKRFATPEEITRLGQLLNAESVKNPRAVAFIYTLMFSGARPRSLERAVWADLTVTILEDKTFGILTFNGKSSAATGEEEMVVIPPQAMDLINKLPVKGELIFNIKMPKDIWYRIRKEAGCEDLWARDLRRTFATIGLSNGVSSSVIGELLNHKSASTTLIYTKLLNTKRIQATKEIADQITLLLTGGNK